MMFTFRNQCAVHWAAILLFVPGLSATAQVCHPAPGGVTTVHSDGAPWHVKGDGIVCCPCAVPCPCRSNAPASYGHCEATLYLRIMEGNYGNVDLSGMHAVESSGMCAVDYELLSALFLDPSSSPEQRKAFMQLLASFNATQIARFPHVHIVPIVANVTENHLFQIRIPEILEMIVDRNWGQPAPPLPEVATPDHFSNLIQYAQNLRYRFHDEEDGLDFDYSHRQANYRKVDLSDEQYRSKSMLIQFEDGTGWFNDRQMEIIRAQHLQIPQLDAIRREARSYAMRRSE